MAVAASHAGRDDEQTAHGETGIPPEAARSESEVLRHIVDQSQAPRLPAVVLDDVDRAEGEPRPPARFPDRQPARHVQLDGALEMEAQLVVQIVLGAAAPVSRKIVMTSGITALLVWMSG